MTAFLINETFGKSRVHFMTVPKLITTSKQTQREPLCLRCRILMGSNKKNLPYFIILYLFIIIFFCQIKSLLVSFSSFYVWQLSFKRLIVNIFIPFSYTFIIFPAFSVPFSYIFKMLMPLYCVVSAVFRENNNFYNRGMVRRDFILNISSF